MTIAANTNRRDAWIPWTFVGGFLVVIAANAALVYFALNSWTGLAIDNPYERGVAHNRALAAVRAQEVTGWKVGLDFASVAAGRGTLTLTLADATGAGIAGATVTGRIKRPTDARDDSSVALVDHGGGRYVADLALPLAGQWDVEATAVLGARFYRIDKRILVR
jgi:nitrogen fixation protein FixH